jgi:SAM-dependent methyltransferase
MKYFDPIKKRLIFVNKSASSDYWDEHWRADDLKKELEAGKRNRIIKNITYKFLSPPAKVIDAGCGIGQNVYALKFWGYDAYGVDFAEKTISNTKKIFPELNVFVQDVRTINFPNGYFDGYWSLGVIEHFWSGYDDIITEANRVLRKGGFLFLTVPFMSPLRKLKAKLGLYEKLDQSAEPENFYQFGLDPADTIDNIEKLGFKLVQRGSYGAVKGLKDEIPLLNKFLQKIYDSNNILAKGTRFFINNSIGWFAGHSGVFVFQKK